MIHTFPSRAHSASLSQEMRDHGSAQLTDEEKRYLHNYRYGMRRVLLGKFDRWYDADPSGKYFDATMANAAEQFYRRQFGNRGMTA